MISRLALGTVQFGMKYGIANHTGKVSQLDINTILGLANRASIDTVDTAIAYGDSEACLGKSGINEFKVITKLPPIPDYCIDINSWVNSHIQDSLVRLNIKSLYGVLLHKPDQLLGSRGQVLYKALQNLVYTGITKKIGISIYNPEILDKLVAIYNDISIVQASFSLIDRRLYITGWMKKLTTMGIEVHTRSTFLQGLLLMRLESIPEKFYKWLELFRRWNEWITYNNMTALQACLAFPLSFPEIDRVVVGVDSVKQINHIIKAEKTLKNTIVFPELSCNDEKLINPSLWR